MIVQKTSTDLMNLLESSQQDITDMRTQINTIESELTKRLQIVKNIQEYSAREMTDLKEMFSNKIDKAVDNVIIFSKMELEGTYDTYGHWIQPSFLKTPTDIFNFGSVTGKIFKNNANVRINDYVKPEYNNMLMNDSIEGKSVAFEEFDTPNIELEITINPSDLLGATSFNAIEIMPYIPGSFNIMNMKIFTMQNYKNSADTPDLEITNEITEVGNSRILLDKTRDLYKFIMQIHINFRNNDGRYPFGLKHLYFLNGDLNPDSNIIFKVKRNNYIQYIGDDIILHDQNGKYDTTCTDEDIKLYMGYDAGVLSLEIATSKGLKQNPVPRNIKEFWVSMPVKRSLYSFTFKNLTLRT